MATVEEPSAICTQDIAELKEVVDCLIKGIRDPEAMRKAGEEMNAGREEIRRRLGEVNLAVELTDRDE
jgi:hypothetical protein